MSPCLIVAASVPSRCRRSVYELFEDLGTGSTVLVDLDCLSQTRCGRKTQAAV